MNLSENFAKLLRWGIFVSLFLPLVIFSQYLSPFHFGKVIIFRTLVEILAVFYIPLAIANKSYRPKWTLILIGVSIFTGLYILTGFTGINFYRLSKLHFEKPDLKKFPCLGLAIYAAKELGSLPAVLNAANEESVNSFLHKKINFLTIPKIVEKVMQCHKIIKEFDFSDIIHVDAWARQEVLRIVANLN